MPADLTPLPTALIACLRNTALRLQWLCPWRSGNVIGREHDHYTLWLAFDWAFEIGAGTFHLRVPLGNAVLMPVNTRSRHLSTGNRFGNLSFGFNMLTPGHPGQAPLTRLNLPQVIPFDREYWRGRFGEIPATISAQQTDYLLQAKPICEAFLFDHLATGFRERILRCSVRTVPDWLVAANREIGIASRDGTFDLAALAKSAGISRTQFSRAFLQHFKETPSACFSRMRMELAARLLAEDRNAEVRQIAAKIGFKSVASFVRCFRSRFGYTPGSVRRGVQ